MGNIIKGICIDYTHDGQAVVKDNGIPIFVPGLLIGEEADIEILYNKKSFKVGKIKKIYKMSKDRIAPRCPVSTACGGCCFQNLSYEKQLEYKKNKVLQAFSRIAGIDIDVENTIGMENPYNYRNKIQIPLKKDRTGKIVSGFYKAKSHDIVAVESCAIEDERATAILKTIKKLMKDMNISPYDEDRRTGIIRHVLIRTSAHYDEVMVVLVTNIETFPSRSNFVKELVKECKITTVVQNINKRDTNVILGFKEFILYGKGFINDSLCGVNFQISSKSFYQVNPVQTEVLYGKAIEFADLRKNDNILDAYCGIGTIGLIASKHVESVTGIEIVPEAIDDARLNAKNNHILNAKFLIGDASDYMIKQKFDCVFVDPPRKGLDEKFLSTLLRAKIKKIVYVSCDPATLARDVKLLSDLYRVEKVQPVDMFPFTYHVETVVALVLKK